MENGIALDSFAVLAYLQAEKGAQQVKELLHQAANGQLSVQMTVINPVSYTHLNKQGPLTIYTLDKKHFSRLSGDIEVLLSDSK